MTLSLTDSYFRKFEYLRLSITDACNFKCNYCLPNGYKPSSCEKFLNKDEISRLVKCFVELGLWKIRITGGEPTLRHDFEKIIEIISNVNGVQSVVASTNGFRLAKYAQAFYNAGLRGVNVSIDSLNPEEFYKITGNNELLNILQGIEKVLQIGYNSVKINVVLLKGFNENSLINYLDYVKNRTVSVRFIELMQTNENKKYFQKHHINPNFIKKYLLQLGFSEKSRSPGDGPAVIFIHSSFKGSIGIIAPYSKDFCTTCNRLRVSAHGNLKLCLFGQGGISLRHLLEDDSQKEDLKEFIINSLKLKQVSHFLNEGDSGDTPHLASIGG